MAATSSYVVLVCGQHTLLTGRGRQLVTRGNNDRLRPAKGSKAPEDGCESTGRPAAPPQHRRPVRQCDHPGPLT